MCGFARTMRDIANKMAELKFEAPLAQFEEADEWGSTEFQPVKSQLDMDALNYNNVRNLKEREDAQPQSLDDSNKTADSNRNANNNQPDANVNVNRGQQVNVSDNFNETFSGSLEDLVNTFDDKITKCFGNYEESVEKLAPVQVRTQEEIMNECQ